MRTSEHFNLNLVEGTDLVNPLTQDVPNYEAIDAAMFANQSASIGTATELKTGTIHALTRANANTNVFRFTATSRFASGDTMTVDGVSVTVTAPNGTALVDGAYIIGSTVLCSLVGQLLTVYTVANAPDAEKLQGHDADYFATAAGLAQAQSLAENAASVAQGASAILDTIGSLTIGSTTGVSLANNTGAVVSNISLQPGTYVLCTNITFPTNGVGLRGMRVVYNNPSPDISFGNCHEIRSAVNGGNTTLHFTTIINISSATDLYLNAIQSAGSALTAFPNMTAVRIK